jgi:NifB/MoaA-like Fe-S oxidoreductase
MEEEYDPFLDADVTETQEYTMDDMIRIAITKGKSIFCEDEAVSDFIKLTVPELVCSYDATNLKIYDVMIFRHGYILRQIVKVDSEQYWVKL